MPKLRPILKVRRAASVKRSAVTAAVRSVMALRAMKDVPEATRSSPAKDRLTAPRKARRRSSRRAKSRQA